MHRSKTAFLLDHLSQDEQRIRNLQAQRLGGGQVDDEIELGRLLDRDVSGLSSAQNLINIVGRAPPQLQLVWPIGHQTAGFDVRPGIINRRQTRAHGQTVDASTITVYQRFDADIKCLRAGVERLEGGRDIFRPLDFNCGDLEIHRAGRCLHRVHLQHGSGTAGIGQDRQLAEARNDLLQQFDSLACNLGLLQRQTCDVAARAPQTRDEAGPDRVSAVANTIGIVAVAFFASEAIGVPEVTIISTLRRTNSAAIAAARVLPPSAQRTAIATVEPSIQPSSRSRRTNAANSSPCDEGVPAPRKPMIGGFPACRAGAASARDAAAPPNSPMNSRLFN